MPQVIITHSNSMSLQLDAIAKDIENTIRKHDSSAGQCKGRLFVADQYTNDYLSVDIKLLKKPQRTPEFIKKVLEDLDIAIKAHIDTSCLVYLTMDFFSENTIISDYSPSS